MAAASRQAHRKTSSVPSFLLHESLVDRRQSTQSASRRTHPTARSPAERTSPVSTKERLSDDQAGKARVITVNKRQRRRFTADVLLQSRTTRREAHMLGILGPKGLGGDRDVTSLAGANGEDGVNGVSGSGVLVEELDEDEGDDARAAEAVAIAAGAPELVSGLIAVAAAEDKKRD